MSLQATLCENRSVSGPSIRRVAAAGMGLAVLGFAFWHTIEISNSAPHAATDPGLWPRMAITLLAVSSAIAFFRRPRGEFTQARSETEMRGGSRVIGSLFAAFLAYAAALTWVGFVFATPPFLLVVAVIAGARGVVPPLLHAVIGTAGAVLLFAGLLNAPMPSGSIGLAYELSSRIYSAASSISFF